MSRIASGKGHGIGAALAVAVTATAASAGIHPTTMRIQVSDGFDSGVFQPAGTDEGGGTYNYATTGYTGGDWDMDWDYNATPFSASGNSADLSSNVVVRNNSGDFLDFSIMISMPLLGAASSDQYFGSSAITIENGTIGTTGQGRAIWTALIDGAFLGDVFQDPYLLDGLSSTNDDNGSIFGADHGGASNSLDISILFRLSPGADMTMTAGFGILGATPAPGALALFGLGALGRRRRRN